MHGSIGPSCAVALWEDDSVTVWTHSQGVYPLRTALAELLGLPLERVRCIHVEGAGCYGHNGADDVAADAALLARAVPGQPVRVQWMREQEHGWEPLGSAMMVEMSAARSAPTAASSPGSTRSGATPTARGRPAPAACWRAPRSSRRSCRRGQGRYRCRKAAASATQPALRSAQRAR